MALTSQTRVAIVSYSMTAASTLKKAEILGRACRLALIRPSRWSWYASESAPPLPGVRVIDLPVVLPGRHHFHSYRGLGTTLRQMQPELLYVDQEPWSWSTFQAVRIGRALGARIVGFTWQNILKRYPPPFNWLEAYVHRATHVMIAGNEEAATILRRRGFAKPIVVAPQFGVDTTVFYPRPRAPRPFGLPEGAVVFGFVGRLVPEKGLETLIEAAATVPGAHVAIAGVGPLRRDLEALVHRRGLQGRVGFMGGFSSIDVADVIASFDVLVLPSLTTPRWKEQFGRVLIEAMACGTPVTGSSSGEIPHVIGDAGLVFREGDVRSCAEALAALMDPRRRAAAGARGLDRVNRLFTQERIAEQTLDAWRLAWEVPESRRE